MIAPLESADRHIHKAGARARREDRYSEQRDTEFKVSNTRPRQAARESDELKRIRGPLSGPRARYNRIDRPVLLSRIFPSQKAGRERQSRRRGCRSLGGARARSSLSSASSTAHPFIRLTLFLLSRMGEEE